jgi:hypothetical protein
MILKRSKKVRRHLEATAKSVTQASVTPRKTVVAVNKDGVRLEVTTKMPTLGKDTVLFVETKRPSGLAFLNKRNRLKELNETWRDLIKV